MKDKYELEYSFICLDWTLTNKDIIGYNWYKPKKVTVYTITDYYYDTEDKLLHKNKYVFRKRLSTKNASIIYTIKGPTEIDSNGVPKRLELETESYRDALTMLENILDVKEPREMEIIQKRITSRTEVKYDGYSMFIDKTSYENGTEYFNIELELVKPEFIDSMKGFAKCLESKMWIYPTHFSKFQIGEVIKKLNLEGRINTDKYMKILGYKKD